MNDTEFEKDHLNLLIDIFPYAKDLPGLRFMINIDSGPIISNLNILSRISVYGYHMYPPVSNITSVSQETDRNCGLFKSIYQDNLLKFSSDRERHKKKSLLIFLWLAYFLGGDK